MSADPRRAALDIFDPGRRSVQQRGRLSANRWLWSRRAVQLSILALFMIGPLAGVWIVKGNLSSSLTLDSLPMTDPFVLLQSLAARHWPEASALIGAGIVLALYLIAGGRAFCSWVCPVNLVTDAASWTRRKLRIHQSKAPSRSLRYWLLAAVVLVAAGSGQLVWESVNPVGLTHRALIFGVGLAWLAVLLVYVYDLFIAHHGWCGHVCPQGAFYGLLGRGSLMRVSAARRARCDDCGDCLVICPETQVIAPALKGKGSPIITSGDCTNCGRCIDVCSERVFRFSHRFDHRTEEGTP